MTTKNNFHCISYKICTQSEIMLKESPNFKYDNIPQQNLEKIAQDFITTLSLQTKQRMNGRLERGLELAINGYVKPISNSSFPRSFLVLSSSRKCHYYVNLAEKVCSCPDSLKGNTCKHRIAAYYVEQALKGFGTKPIPSLKLNGNAIENKSTEELIQALGFNDNLPKGQLKRTIDLSPRNRRTS